MKIVLVEPEIPQNTGNIGRTCAALGAQLNLIEPLGFSLEEKMVKRAGLDYWHLIDYARYPSFSAFLEANPGTPLFFLSTKGAKVYTELSYPADCALVFGRESAGLPEELLQAHPERCIRIPMREEARSMNLANSVAIAAFEVMRQNNFPGLLREGIPRTFSWS
ncbi:tRNA (cytidine(34)-2'-O)-methyltransferase [Marispirochaeta aestuarii]|uniref:tRNA (cytidine(34)-2'-O)-methyltransferase n=1 Tax=Marispirochaeta aestuarii TaxID=1963862 RepID=UPI0029C86B73|nr:tRNA (cytidine(34)-2'-O)-methyltransferase [Marispirochaeta aestuarii]